jgi:hypothetical protein
VNSDLFVGKFYSMDPETEDLIFGSQLQNGMVVLVEDPMLRGDPSKTHPTPADERHVRQANRWAEVTERRRMGTRSGEVHIRFIAVYADGTKAARVYLDTIAWLVKKDSMPVKEKPSLGDLSMMGDEKLNPPVEKVTFEQLGTGHRVTVDKKELVGTITDISEDEDGLKVEGTLTEEGLDYVKADAEASMENYGETGSGVDEDDDTLTEEGPMVRAMRQHERPLREKHTVTKTEVVEIYGLDRLRPRYNPNDLYGRWNR